MTTQFRCQSTQRNFYKQALPLSCRLCSDPPRRPTGPGLTRPERWPSGQGPSRGARAGTGPPAKVSSTQGRARGSLSSPLGKAWVPVQTEARGPRAEPRPGCWSQELKVGQEPVLGWGFSLLVKPLLSSFSATCQWLQCNCFLGKAAPFLRGS